MAVAAQQSPRTRSVGDLADDLIGYQVHALYVLPSDAADDQLDTNGVIEASVNSFQAWLAAQTGGRKLRFDTYNGRLDVSFVRLSQTDAYIRSSGALVRDLVEAGISNAGFYQPTKLYAVYYGGISDTSCGGGASPPTLPGSAAMLYLKGLPDGPIPCAANRFASTGQAPGYLELAMLHEIVHTLGFVAPCAPHYAQAGHVSDDPTDLMYAGSQPWRPAALDANHDDYFQHNIPGCLDLAKSLFLDSEAADGIQPPGWPYLDSASLSCDQEAATRSVGSGPAATVEFVNGSSADVTIYWLDAAGKRQPYGRLGPLQKLTQNTFVNHAWLIADFAGQCQSIRFASDATTRSIIRDTPQITAVRL